VSPVLAMSPAASWAFLALVLVPLWAVFGRLMWRARREDAEPMDRGGHVKVRVRPYDWRRDG